MTAAPPPAPPWPHPLLGAVRRAAARRPCRALCLAFAASCSGSPFVADTPPADETDPGGTPGLGEGEGEPGPGGEGEGEAEAESESEAEAESESEADPLGPGCEASAPCTPEGGGACDLVCQTGCPAEQRCALGNDSAPMCQPHDATVPLCGYGCSEGDCAPGGACVEAFCDPGSFCAKFCRGDGDCPVGYRCTSELSDEAGRPIGVRVCSELPFGCDPVTPQGCPVDMGCYLAGSEPDGRPITQCVCGAGDGGDGSPCPDSPLDCRPGLICLSVNNGPLECHRACDEPRGGCPDGRLCAEIAFDGSDNPVQGIGACI